MSAVPSRRRRRRRSSSPDISARAEKILARAREHASQFENPMFAAMYVHAVEQKVVHSNNVFFEFLRQLEQPPVSIETFLDSEDFFGSTDLRLWPVVRQAIIDINKYWWRGVNDPNAHAYNEALLMGATGTGKSEIAKVTLAYHLHILGCMKNAQEWYGLPKATAIAFAVMAAKPHVIKRVLYLPLRSYIETMPWFQEHMRPDRLIESEMFFTEQNIRVVPAGSDADAILGEAIIGGILDEVNFMQVVQQSRRAEVSESGRGGKYDQAATMHTAITRRKQGRFLRPGPMIGLISVSSSTRYKNDFTDRRKDEVLRAGLDNVYIYDKAQYEAKGLDHHSYSGEMFEVAIINEAATDIMILDEDTRAPRSATIIEVPIEYREDFLTDPAGSLRDICGISVNALNPFIRRRAKISEAVVLGQQTGLESFLVKDNVILGVDGMPVVTRGHFCQNPSRPRYVHIDLSKNADRCGIAMVRFDGLEEVSRRTNAEVETLPIVSVELACSIEPDHATEIDIGEVRAWVRMLHVVYGYPIKGVSYDGWNSLESRQQWKKQGMRTAQVTVDRSSVEYKQFRDALYDGRIRMYNNPVLIEELMELEYDEKRDKVDHPPRGSKDVADAVCAAYHVLLSRATTWQLTDESRVDFEERPDFEDRLT